MKGGGPSVGVGGGSDFLSEPLPHRLALDTQAGQGFGRHSLVRRHDPEQQVLGPDPGVTQKLRLLLGPHQGGAGRCGEPLEHDSERTGGTYQLAGVETLSRGRPWLLATAGRGGTRR